VCSKLGTNFAIYRTLADLTVLCDSNREVRFSTQPDAP
jgi:hypothetical protein